MSVIAFVQATNLQEVEGKPGVLVNMLFRMDGQAKTLELEGMVSVAEEMDIGSIEVTADELGLGAEVNSTLLHAGARACWKSIFVHHRAATGFQWQSLRPWLRSDEQAVIMIESGIGEALSRSS